MVDEEEKSDLEKDEPSWRAEIAVAGMAVPLQSLRELVLWPFLYAQEAASIGLKWPKGLLLHGPPGTGKTSLVRAVAKECDAHFTSLSGGFLHRSYAGESERVMREAFAEAASQAVSCKPAIIFIDEIDTLCPRRDSRRQQETRIVAQLLTLMDGIKSKSGSSSHVVVVAATNRVNAIDPALRRPGRFDRELAILPPNTEERYEILCLHAKNLPVDGTVDLRTVAAMCNGYVGADLQALCREAAMSALQKALKEGLKEDQVKLVGMEEWEEARKNVGPSIVRGTAAEVPKVSWEDIGGLHEVKKRLQQAVEWPIKHSDAFSRLGIRPIRGVLLHGPPGCCKTSLVRAAAHAAQATLISLRYRWVKELADCSMCAVFSLAWPGFFYSSHRQSILKALETLLYTEPKDVMKVTDCSMCAVFSVAWPGFLHSSHSGAELYSMYVGEGESLVRETFSRARLAAPSIIFFDEVDAVASRRKSGSGAMSSGSGDGTTVAEKLLSTLLTEIDGLEQAQAVLVLAATNRPETIDAALMRPGRFDSVIFVPPPDLEGRLEVLRIHTRRIKVGNDVSLEHLAEETECYTGAELAGLCRESGMVALRESLAADTVFKRHFDSAKASMTPLLTPLQISSYATFNKGRLKQSH